MKAWLTSLTTEGEFKLWTFSSAKMAWLDCHLFDSNILRDRLMIQHRVQLTVALAQKVVQMQKEKEMGRRMIVRLLSFL